MPKVLVHTLGCKLNQLESEAYEGEGKREEGKGSGEQPTIIIVNTCTVTSKADQKARRVIRKALRDYPDATVIVTGCYAALEKEKIEELDLHGGAADSSNRAQRLLVLKREEVLNYLNPKPRTLDPMSQFQFFPEKFSNHTRAFLKIQDGCDNHCTYCRIRLARGKSVSLSADQVLERLRILEKNHAEAVLTGVNICQYREKGKGKREKGEKNLFDLLEYLLSNTKKIAIRLSSLDPLFIVENLLPPTSYLLPSTSYLLHSTSYLLPDRIRPHFHLSIQSCSEKILQRMGRSYNAQIIEKAVSLLRSAKDDPFLACDIITGFPGETETEFMETYELCRKLGFAWIHVFPYSKRPGTVAASFKDTVKESEVTRRVQMLTDLAWQGRREYVRRWIGRDVEIVIQGTRNNEQCSGLSENYLKVLIRCDGEPPLPGTVLRCHLMEEADMRDYDVVGED